MFALFFFELGSQRNRIPKGSTGNLWRALYADPMKAQSSWMWAINVVGQTTGNIGDDHGSDRTAWGGTSCRPGERYPWFQSGWHHPRWLQSNRRFAFARSELRRRLHQP